MYRKIPYVPAELQIVDKKPGMFRGPELEIRNTPVTPRANHDAAFDDRHPYWMPSIRDTNGLSIPLYHDMLGRGMGKDVTDAFGVHWVFVPDVGGSMEAPNVPPLMEDVNEWREKIRIPDIDAWDWEKAARESKIDPRYPCYITLINGFWFERLLSFMGFMPAAMALIDEEQTDAIKELFSALTDLGCRVVDKLCTLWPMLDCIEVHDDWGSQMAPFFSMDVAYELFVPYMKRFTDHIHDWGRHTMLHSCGHTFDRVQCYIDAGFDMWTPQPMNEIEELYERWGDKMIFGVFPRETDLASRSEEEQRAAARAFAERYCKPGKPALLGVNAIARMTPAFEEELYIHSRRLYLEQDD